MSIRKMRERIMTIFIDLRQQKYNFLWYLVIEIITMELCVIKIIKIKMPRMHEILTNYFLLFISFPLVPFPFRLSPKISTLTH